MSKFNISVEEVNNRVVRTPRSNKHDYGSAVKVHGKEIFFAFVLLT